MSSENHSNLSDSQNETLKAFRKTLYEEDILHDGDSIGTDDETLLRFLRARKFNLAHSIKMFKDCQDWRKTAGGVGIDELYKKTDPFDYPERQDVFECWPMYFHKTDKQGRPLNFHFYGAMDLNKLYKKMTPERHWETFMANCECLPREILPGASKAAAKPIGTVFVVCDLKGFGVSQFWQMKSLARSAFQISQDYYPETMGKLAIINAPSSFAYIFSIMKPWLAPETRQKVSILGGDYLNVLLEDMDIDAIPTTLGGTCTCSEHGGCAISGAGPWMDGRKGWGPQAQARPEAINGTSSDNDDRLSGETCHTRTATHDDKAKIQEPVTIITSKEEVANDVTVKDIPEPGAAKEETDEHTSLPPSPTVSNKPTKRSWFGSRRDHGHHHHHHHHSKHVTT